MEIEIEVEKLLEIEIEVDKLFEFEIEIENKRKRYRDQQRNQSRMNDFGKINYSQTEGGPKLLKK